MNNRKIKIFFGAAIALFMFLVSFNNLMDYYTNFRFVQMVTGMEDVFTAERTGWRSIKNETIHHILYLVIIACEITTALLVTDGVYRLTRKYRSGAGEFNAAKKTLATGMWLGVMIWFVIFLTIGGEWFLMWQSEKANAQQTSFFLTITFMLFLVHLNQRDE